MAADPTRWGVEPGYHDDLGQWRVPGAEAVTAILTAMGAAQDVPPGPDVLVVRPGQAATVTGVHELAAEDGVASNIEGALPVDLSIGYHRLTDLDSGAETMVIVSPGRCPQPDRRAWGWAVQVYAVRSATSWGIGDLGDLEALARWSHDLGAGFMLTNPLHAAPPGPEQTNSPYSPSSRRFLNPLYLDIAAIPGAGEILAGGDLGALARQAQGLNTERIIDRNHVYRLKMEALELIWQATSHNYCEHDGGDFDRFVIDRGHSLESYATWCGLTEHFGNRWRTWPERYRHPKGPSVARFARDNAHRVRFHAWLQWLTEQQLMAVTTSLPQMADLAVGVDPEGADAWLDQDCYAPNFSVGAPPDDFNRAGQDWGLPPFDPWRLRQAHYGPFIETLRASLRQAWGLRVDHVMGLFRLWWLPAGHNPTGGAYVRYPSDDLLAILAVEACRAGACVVGEDLGTVSPPIRSALAEAGVYSTRLGWFEDTDPDTWPTASLAALTTHDLPTTTGIWNRCDPDSVNLEPLRRRLARLAGADPAQPAGSVATSEVAVAAHRSLARAGSTLATATLDDALGVAERPNVPGTIDEWPNWRLALPRTLQEIMTDPLPASVAQAMGETRSGSPGEAA